MATLTFTDKTAKDEVASAIREIEGATSAEVVVAVRPRSGHYRHTDYLVGFATAFAALLVFLFDPHEFNIDWMPVDTLVAFGIGILLSSSLHPLRRMLTSRKLMRSNVRTAARTAFVDLNVSDTSGRSGILVFVSMFERNVDVVTDVGIDREALGPAFAEAMAALKSGVDRGPNFPRFVEALRSLGPILGAALPRHSNDVNELPDQPSA